MLLWLASRLSVSKLQCWWVQSGVWLHFIGTFSCCAIVIQLLFLVRRGLCAVSFRQMFWQRQRYWHIWTVDCFDFGIFLQDFWSLCQHKIGISYENIFLHLRHIIPPIHERCLNERFIWLVMFNCVCLCIRVILSHKQTESIICTILSHPTVVFGCKLHLLFWCDFVAILCCYAWKYERTFGLIWLPSVLIRWTKFQLLWSSVWKAAHWLCLGCYQYFVAVAVCRQRITPRFVFCILI